jgi:PPK2 family polyphosphate:nucleotide phosphotransferase
LQQPVLAIWRGDAANTQAAQAALLQGAPYYAAWHLPLNFGRHMNYTKQFRIVPGSDFQLKKLDPGDSGKHGKKSARKRLAELHERMDELQFRLYSEQQRSVLICLQALDAGGKDGVVRHVISSMNPQGCHVVGFKQPSAEELAHDFLWRIEAATPRRGTVTIFNRSHYEDVLIVRVHDLVPKKVWSKRYEQINDFERRLHENGTQILKFFLHISKEEQLERFKDRLDDPTRHWKISEADYSERKYWSDYEAAFQDAISKCNTEQAPWFVIPSDHKWFRNLAISEIIVETMEELDFKLPPASVDIAAIRGKYHEAVGRSVAEQ